MKWILRIVSLFLISLIVLVGGLQLASEMGEVVIVTTTDESGAPVETRLWVVEYEGYQYLRSGDPGSGWYQRLVVNPEVRVARKGEAAMYTAVPDPEKVDEINRLMAEKYGLSEAYIGAILGRENSVAVRLEPIQAQ